MKVIKGVVENIIGMVIVGDNSDCGVEFSGRYHI